MSQQPWETTLPRTLPATDQLWGGFVDLAFATLALQWYGGVGDQFAGGVCVFSSD